MIFRSTKNKIDNKYEKYKKLWTKQDTELKQDLLVYNQPCTIRSKRNNKRMNKRNK